MNSPEVKVEVADEYDGTANAENIKQENLETQDIQIKQEIMESPDIRLNENVYEIPFHSELIIKDELDNLQNNELESDEEMINYEVGAAVCEDNIGHNKVKVEMNGSSSDEVTNLTECMDLSVEVAANGTQVENTEECINMNERIFREINMKEMYLFFKHKSTLNVHFTEHSDTKNYQCAICGKRLLLKSNLNTHLLTHFAEKKPQCAICGKSFKYKSKLNIHFITHSKKHECVICGRNFKLKSNLNAHLLSHDDTKTPKCTICGKCFAHKSYLNRHLLSHNDTKNQYCTICGRRFSYKSNLNHHVLMHSNVKKNECAEKVLNTSPV